MRTTITLEDDVAAAVERLRRERGAGISDVVNQLVRAGLATRDNPKPYVHRSTRLGLKIDVDDIAEVLDVLDAE